MDALNLPTFDFKIKNENNQNYILDEIRGKYLLLTPEEWVRQNFVKFLINYKKVPAALISLEMGFKNNKKDQRSDIAVYNRHGNIQVIVECKSPKIKISQNTFDQAASYNLKLNAEYIIITNGMQHYCIKPDYENRKWMFLKDIPNYENL
jgi:hypothetical protein